jgi:pyruvate dehydrogenase E2 component (dihydrolipoamide acetyltransferase)
MTEAGARIVMPKLGLSMTEGLLAEWLVAPGDEVAAGQVLFVVETDKISNEVEAPAPGRILSLLVEAGATVDVGAPLALWTGPGQGVGEPVDEAPAPARVEVAPSAAAPTPTGDRVRATPFARRLARQGGIDIHACPGSGPRGRIQARDVRAALEPKPVAVPPRGRDLRALIAARVSRSRAEIPHFYVTADAAFDALIALRAGLNADPASPARLSVTAFLSRAVARALTLLPEANVVWREGRAVALPGIAIAIAVDTADGVMAPVVPFEGQGDIYAAAADLEAAIARARAGRLSSADAGEAAIGISNVGMFNVRALTPIIDPDQSFMLGVGAPQSVFRPGPHGRPRAVKEVTLTLACDHRAIDGAGAARFLSQIVELLEQPARLLMSGG